MAIQFCVSEADAMSKWCPFTRPVFPRAEDCGATPGNRPMGLNTNWREISGTTCIGSDCMAWRWVETNINIGDGSDLIKSTDTHGYCGLAGSPVP